MKFAILLIFTVLLSGCASKTPTETIIDNHIGHINEVLDYAQHNIDQTPDVMLLEGELKSCQIALADVKESYKGDKQLWQSKINYWRMMCMWLVFSIGAMVVAWLKRWLK